MGLNDKNGHIESGKILYNGLDLAGVESDKEWSNLRGGKIAMVLQILLLMGYLMLIKQLSHSYFQQKAMVHHSAHSILHLSSLMDILIQSFLLQVLFLTYSLVNIMVASLIVL